LPAKIELIASTTRLANRGTLVLDADRAAFQLAQRAVWAQRRISDGIQYDVEQGEETITQTILLDLSIALPNLKVYTFTRRQESRSSGADWEWWWQGETRWFGALIQAKKLSSTPSGKSRYRFDYRPRAASRETSPRLQVETIIDASRNWGIPAIYVLYNGPEAEFAATHCPIQPFYAPFNGITFITADVAQHLMASDRNDLASVARYARPWSCLLSCEPTACAPTRSRLPRTHWSELGFDREPEGDDLAYRAATALFSSYALTSIQGRGNRRHDEAFDLVRRAVRAEPPRYVIDPSDDEHPPARRLAVMRRT